MIAIAPTSSVLPGHSNLETQQLYQTHCLYGEGVQVEAGFVVRACSRQDPLLFRFVSEYPVYEAIGNTAGEGKVSEWARLALIRLPGGQSILMHTVASPRTAGRLNNFFSHIVWRSKLGIAEALTTWGSSDWVLSCPREQGKELPVLESLPKPGILKDQLVTSFVVQEGLRKDRNGSDSSVSWPDRLVDRSKRRELLIQMLRGVMLAGQAGAGSPRGRLYIRAEPALVALLLYATARILPPKLLEGLTFSTYEPRYCLGLFRQAQIVGTWSDDPADSLDEMYFKSRGYAIDTLTGTVSPEFQEPTDPLFGEWLDQVAAGEWNQLDEINAGLNQPSWSPSLLRQAIQAVRVGRPKESGTEGGLDLQALKLARERMSGGANAVGLHGTSINGNGKIEPDYKLKLPELLVEGDLLNLENEISQALQGGLTTEWQSSWNLLKSALKTRPARLAEALPRILPPVPFPSGLRLQFLRDLEDLQLSSNHQKMLLPSLLKGSEPDELRELCGSDLPLNWVALAICYGLVSSDSRPEAGQLLLAGSNDLFAAFWTQIDQIKDLNQRINVLGSLISSAGGPGDVLLGRLLESRCKIRPDTFLHLLEALKVFDPEWSEFWLKNSNWNNLLDRFVEQAEEIPSLWKRLTRLLDGNLLFNDPLQTLRLQGLLRVQEPLGDRFPENARQMLRDWELLREHFIQASGVNAEDRQPLLDACRRLGLNPDHELKGYFERFLSRKELNEAQLADFSQFFLSLYPEASWHEDHSRRLGSWIEVVEACPEKPLRARYQDYFLNHNIPEPLRERLKGEFLANGKWASDQQEATVNPAQKTQLNGKKDGDATRPTTLGVAGKSASANPIQNEIPELVGENPVTLGEYFTRASGLLLSLIGGLIVAFIFAMSGLSSRLVVNLAPFLPLVISISEAAGLFATVGAAGFESRKKSNQSILNLILSGLVMSVLAGALGSGVALFQGLGIPLAQWLGISIALAMLVGVGTGVGVRWLFSRFAPQRQKITSTVARVIAGIFAMVILIQVARFMFPK